MLANLLVKPFWILGVEVGVQNAVGNEVYGFYFSIFNLAYILNILLDLGVTNFNTRNIAQHPQLIGKHLSGILGIKVCLLGLYLVVAFTAGALLGYGSQEFRLLAWLTLCQFLNSLILYLRSNFEGLLLFRWDSLFSVLDRVLMILICGCLLWGPLREGFNIYWFVYAQAIAYGLTALLAFAIIARKAHFRRLRWDRRFFLVILKQSAPFALLVLLMASYNRIDPILLRRLASDAEAASTPAPSAFSMPSRWSATSSASPCCPSSRKSSPTWDAGSLPATPPSHPATQPLSTLRSPLSTLRSPLSTLHSKTPSASSSGP